MALFIYSYAQAVERALSEPQKHTQILNELFSI